MNKMPWEVAQEEGKTAICRVFGPMIAVYYPYRRTGDMYVAIKGHSTVHCCQCYEDVPNDGFLDHVRHHNRFERKYPNLIIDPGLVEPELPQEAA